MGGLFAVLYGSVSYGLCLVTLLYAMGFAGNLVVPKSIELRGGGAARRERRRQRNAARLVRGTTQRHGTTGVQALVDTHGAPLGGAQHLCVVCKSCVAAFYWQWRPIPAVVWAVQDPLAVAAINAIYWLGWGVLLVSTFLISHFELFGLSQVFARLLGRELPAAKFNAPLLYRHVRHPIYLGFLLAFWATPVMTIGHLLFVVATTGYILIAIQLEERDLIALFGDQYRRYRQHVAMLLPLPGRRLVELKDVQVGPPARDRAP